MTDNKNNKKILIVGAGAMGIVTGYHLSLGKSKVSFLAKPSQIDTLTIPQQLYSYDDHTLKNFFGYEVLTEVTSEVAMFDYILITLSGDVLEKPDGKKLLENIADVIRDSKTVVIIGSVGFALPAFFMDTMKLLKERFVSGVLGLLAYQPDRITLPLHAPSDATLLNRANVAYRHVSPKGFIIDDGNLEQAKDFIACYNASGISQCQVMKHNEFKIFMILIFPLFIAMNAKGWPIIDDLRKDAAIWELTMNAIKEILSLNEHGPEGVAMASGFNDNFVLDLWNMLEKESAPLDMQAFSRFHHGDKVLSQDIEMLRACVVQGEKEGKSMTSLKELLEMKY